MSYSLITQCGDCQLAQECSDNAALQGAVYGIHMTGSQRGHKGAGCIKVECCNRKPLEKPQICGESAQAPTSCQAATTCSQG